MSRSQPVGLLLIPDISGFTQFVSEVEISHSKHIVSELLELLIDSNKLNLDLCEVEGDALFYYKQGDIPAFAASWIKSITGRGHFTVVSGCWSGKTNASVAHVRG